MNSNSVPDNTEKTIRGKLTSFYLEEIDPKNQSHCGATTLFEHPAFNEDSNVRAIRERYKDNPNTADDLLRLLIFIEYKLVQKGEDAASWFKDTLAHNPRQPERARHSRKKLQIKYTKDLDCDREGALLYSCLWPELKPKEVLVERFENYVRYEYTLKGETSSLTLQGDCMCSALEVLKDGLYLFKKEHKNVVEQLMKDDNYARLLRYKAKDGTCKQGFPAGLRQYLRAIRYDMCSGNNHLKKVWADPFFLNFLKESFSRANWIVIPNGMNKPRAKNPIKDYWDRTMERMLANQEGIAASETPESQITGLEKYRAPFRELLEREWMLPGEDSPKPGYQALLLEDWLYLHEGTGELHPFYLPPRKANGPYPHRNWKNPGPKSFGEWETMLTEMTRRIQSRREEMVKALVKVPSEQLKESGLIPSSFEEEQR